MAAWDLSRSGSCGVYLPGHHIHWIHFNKSAQEPSAAIPVSAHVGQGGHAYIEGDELSLVLWNHRPDALETALHRFEGMALWKPRWHLLAVPTDASLGSAASVFNMATTDQKTACRATGSMKS
ncbi:hypothetical protein [Mycolicibacterium sp. CBMA 226]|uniref:hypothetical protein n=1 Tax=Mycolicibacterium sp. CBMA 226 TaxID=2606611 RepID=UPI0012DCED0C|nr:hypothetical protein [Mycolicibacterium sp. CBMA 226]MUL76442.1 hypothetical protein [Mycolicibacterium sp. CBMA 226]